MDQCVMSHISMSHVTYQWVMSRINASCHTCKWVMSHMNASYYTYQWVLSHFNASCHVQCVFRPHTNTQTHTHTHTHTHIHTNTHTHNEPVARCSCRRRRAGTDSHDKYLVTTHIIYTHQIIYLSCINTEHETDFFQAAQAGGAGKDCKRHICIFTHILTYCYSYIYA